MLRTLDVNSQRPETLDLRPAYRPAHHVSAGCSEILGLLQSWRQRYATRLALGELDDRLLADIGLTREQASLESSTAFWRS